MVTVAIENIAVRGSVIHKKRSNSAPDSIAKEVVAKQRADRSVPCIVIE